MVKTRINKLQHSRQDIVINNKMHVSANYALSGYQIMLLCIGWDMQKTYSAISCSGYTAAMHSSWNTSWLAAG
jgi:hypothetical protein